MFSVDMITGGAPAAPDASNLDLVRAAMREKPPKVASAYDAVYNDECMLSFDTPLSADGLYVSLTSFQGFGAEHVALDHEKTGNRLYVHFKHTRVAKEAPPAAAADAAAPTKMAIGGEGGFAVDVEKWEIVKEHALVVMPQKASVALPNPELPEIVIQAANALIAKSSCLGEEQQKTMAWEEEPAKPSKYAADLVQLPVGDAKISPDPSTWVCAESGMRENLWLNLSDGHIGSGRRQYDGSGGTNGALDHYTITRTTHPPHGFPLVVKLGTITPHGADVYSYAPDEDDLVVDPKLAEHLAHWGIDVMKMEKTEKSMAEVNVEAQASAQFCAILRNSAQLF